LDRTEEALKAIEEAERIDASNPDVWYQVNEKNRSETDSEPLCMVDIALTDARFSFIAGSVLCYSE